MYVCYQQNTGMWVILMSAISNNLQFHYLLHSSCKCVCVKIIWNALSVNPLNVSVPSISAFRASECTLNVCLQCKKM